MNNTIVFCHGSGNTFILVDEYEKPLNISEDIRLGIVLRLIELYKTDGIIFFQKSFVANCKIRIFNADGSETELCGNAMRCATRYLIENYTTT